ncbi:hypothetical protein MMC08_006570 [Hypocenomyce scalaris]|nr:hypothetical protein [Hypocenomyce scalaris]
MTERDPQRPPPPPPPPPSSSSSADNSIFSPRSRRQLSLFLAGSTFFTLSILTTRRSLLRRHRLTRPSFYHPSNQPPRVPVNGAMEAFEALTIATMNVTSFAMMMTGGALWAFDISSLEDLRRKVRGGLGVDGTGRGESDVEQEFEEWLATVLARKEEKEKAREGGVLEEVRKNERGMER